VLAAFDAIARKSRHHENPCIIDTFERSKKYRTDRCAVAPCTKRCARRALLKAQDVVWIRARARCIAQKHWFFYRAVVMPMQWPRSPRALGRYRHSLRLGGQHGEEAKEDSEGSEEGR
jgi:hypothetical protein